MREPSDGSETDVEELRRLSAPEWMLDQLNLNPKYIHWAPGWGDMKGFDGDYSWDGAQGFLNWNAFGPWELNELNELVNFYFEIERGSRRGSRVHLQLVLWFLHPIKGASRGVVVRDIQEDQLHEVYKFLHEAKRNADRFFSIPE